MGMNRLDKLDNRIEQALYEIGDERKLSPAQRNRIRAAMHATARQRARQREQSTRGLGSLFSSRLMPASLALAAFVLLAFAAYVFTGGAVGQPVAQAQSAAAFTLRQRHTAPFGINWYTDHIVQPGAVMAVAEGDILYAPQVVTMTFTDQSVGMIHPDTEVAALVAQSGLELRFGQVDMAVRHATQAAAANTGPRFSVETRRADVAVKGTKFSVQSSGESDTVMTTEGVVAATQRTSSGSTYSADIRVGEEVRLVDDATAPPIVQLHAPLARVVEPSGRAIPADSGTREQNVSLVGSAYPGGILTANQSGMALTTTVDAQGQFTVPITLPMAEGTYPFTLTIQSPDGRSRTGHLDVIVDKTAPNLTIEIPAPSPDGARLHLSGQTEPGATITVNGIVFAVGTDGTFGGDIDMPADRAVRVVATDVAGNESTLVQSIQR